MRETILQGLEQVYSNFVHMIAEFLPRFLVMLIIIAGRASCGFRAQVHLASASAPDET